ncbi:hypothetical protein FHG87_015781 [Trinorchestia longiramus]|nr:hypothetical protein FHG87_015781 [Trinorchestia longiramus]
MSWFEMTGFSSLARSALKEAQKTIDKALDIKDPDAPAEGSVSSAAASTSKKEVVAVQPITSSRRPDPLPPLEELVSPSTTVASNINLATTTSDAKDSIFHNSESITSTNSLQILKSNESSKESFNTIFSSDTFSATSADQHTMSSILPDKSHPVTSLWGSENDSSEFVPTSLLVSSSGVPNRVGEEEVDWGWGSGITDSMVDGVLQQQNEESTKSGLAPDNSEINPVTSSTSQMENASQKHAGMSEAANELPCTLVSLNDKSNKDVSQNSETKSQSLPTAADDDDITNPCDIQVLAGEQEANIAEASTNTQSEVSSPEESSSDVSNECTRSAKNHGHASASSVSDGVETASSSDSTRPSSDSFAVISSTTSSSIDTIEEFQSPKSPISPESSDEQDNTPQLSSSFVDSKKSSSFSHCQGEAPLTVQPSKSPLKASSMATVIDSQVTRGEAGASKSTGSRWGGSSGTSDSDHSDAGSEATEVSAGTITTQPVGVADSASIGWDNQKWDGADSSNISWESQKWDSCSEDMSASESVQSSSSVVTLIEGSAISTSEDLVSSLPERTSLTKAPVGKLNTGTSRSSLATDRELETISTEVENSSKPPENISCPKPAIAESQVTALCDVISAAPEKRLDLNLSPRTSTLVSDEVDKSCFVEGNVIVNELDGAKAVKGVSDLGTELPVSVPLDVSVESGGSSDTITASLDSTALAGACGDDGEWSTLGDETPVPHLLKEAIREPGKFGKAPDNDEDLPTGSSGETEQMETQRLTSDALQKSYVQVGEEFYPDCLEQKITTSVQEAVPEHCSSGGEHPGPERDHSPSSSDSLTSEMVKVGGSEQTSGHTSGDEFETTTSSDIEVISSPSLDGVSVYGGMYNNMGPGNAGGGVLLGPAHNTASRVWHSAQQRLKSLLVEPPGTNGSSKGSGAGSAADRGLWCSEIKVL